MTKNIKVFNYFKKNWISYLLIIIGLNKDSSIATPNNIYEAGWYKGSSKPSQNGAVFIYAHLSSWKANGIFYNLKKLVKGDKLSVLTGDNRVLNYELVNLISYPANQVDMNAVLNPFVKNTKALNLMTCDGKLLPGKWQFDHRLVVFTKQI